ncbi:MAG: GntR family transcriptional regulator [Blastocatellales bacterium]
MSASPTSGKVEVAALRVIIQDKIKLAIWEGNLKPGDRIVETQLARDFGVSQAPVREALRELEQKGLIVSHPRRGSFVAKPSGKTINEFYSLRITLERFAVRLAVPQLTEEKLEELQRLVDGMRKLKGRDIVSDLVRYDQLFHETLVGFSNHALLAKTWANLQPVQWTHITIARSLINDPQLVARSHQELIDVLRTRKVQAIEKKLEEHILRSMEDMAAQFGDS